MTEITEAELDEWEKITGYASPRVVTLRLIKAYRACLQRSKDHVVLLAAAMNAREVLAEIISDCPDELQDQTLPEHEALKKLDVALGMSPAND